MKYALILAALLVSGCMNSTGEQISMSKSAKMEYAHDTLFFYIDKTTGCHYLRIGNGDSLVPRLRPDGKQLCRQVDVKSELDLVTYYPAMMAVPHPYRE